MFFTIESDREVQISGIGVLKPGEPHQLTDEEIRLFELYQGVSLIKANFPPYIAITAEVGE